jgi:hypothetical protein
LKKLFILNTTCSPIFNKTSIYQVFGKNINFIVITSRLILHTLSSNYPLWRGGANFDLLFGIRGSATIFLTRALMDCRRFFCLGIVDDFDFYRFGIGTRLGGWETLSYIFFCKYHRWVINATRILEKFWLKGAFWKRLYETFNERTNLEPLRPLWSTVKPVYNDHARDPKIVADVDRCSLFRGHLNNKTSNWDLKIMVVVDMWFVFGGGR